MPYIRKTADEWTIQGNYGYGFEDEASYDSRKEASADLRAYRESGNGGVYRLIKRRIRKETLLP